MNCRCFLNKYALHSAELFHIDDLAYKLALREHTPKYDPNFKGYYNIGLV